jgi:hypothetical protein
MRTYRPRPPYGSPEERAGRFPPEFDDPRVSEGGKEKKSP